MTRCRRLDKHGVIPIGIAGKSIRMHVETEDRGRQRVNVLAVMERIAAAAVAECRIKITIRTEAQPTGFVVGNAIWLVDRDDERRTRGIGLVGVGRADVVPPDFCVAAAIDQVDIEIPVLGKVRIEGEAEETLLARG